MWSAVVGLLIALVAISPDVQAVSYDFQEKAYSLTETRDVDNVVQTANVVDVIIIRSGTAAELALPSTITLAHDECPKCVTPTATHGDDYSYSGTVSFTGGSSQQEVSITIQHEDEQENEELFCLTIKTDPGVLIPSAVFSIPANDYCFIIPSAIDLDYDVANAYYGNQWNTDEMLDIDITPEAGGAGDDICIFLTNYVDTTATDFRFYAIFLDDNTLATHDTSGYVNGNSAILNNGITGTPGVDEYTGGDLLTEGSTFSLWISYDQSSGTLAYGRTSDRNSPIGSHDFASADTYDIKHVFVSSCSDTIGNDFATFKICQAVDPLMSIEPIGASSNGFEYGPPERVLDRNYQDGGDFTFGSCFLSADVVDPWIRVDLGKEYYVACVQIDSLHSNGPNSIDETDLDGAMVSVGSCEGDNLANNHVCSSDIGESATDVYLPWEVECPARTVGRYVYVYQNTVSSFQFGVCEITVYGREVTYDSEDRTTVEFKESSYSTSENTNPIITATRSGERATCTTVEYFTRRQTAIGGESGDLTRDYTTLACNAYTPETLEWLSDSTTTIERTLGNVVIHDDYWCEDEESFTVELANVVGGYLGQHWYTRVNITDNDDMTFSISQPTSPVSEGNGSPLQIRVDRTGTGLMQDATAGLRLSAASPSNGGAIANMDYIDIYQTLQFAPATSAATLADFQMGSVSLLDDECYEEDETFEVRLDGLSPSCALVGSPSSATITVQDDDSKFEWDVGSDIIQINEGDNPRSIVMTRDGAVITKDADYTMQLINAQASDFSISPSGNTIRFSGTNDRETIDIAVDDDYEVESTESFTLTIDATDGCPCGNRGDPYRIRVDILDNDAKYYWRDSSLTVPEDSGSVSVCLRRMGDTTTQQTVGITSSGVNTVNVLTARSGEDFVPLSEITFLASDGAEKCVNVQINQDNIAESSETFSLTITPNQDLEIEAANSVLTVTITDEDSQIGWESTNYNVNEGIGRAELIITKTGNSAAVVSYSTGTGFGTGSATGGSDYTPTTTSITLPESQTSVRQSVFIPILNDAINEQTETFTVSLSLSSNSGTITSATTTVTITDDDLPTTEAPPDNDLSGGAIAGIVVAAVVGLLVILGAVVFLLCTMGGLGLGAGAAGAGAAGAGAAGTAGVGGALGAQQLANYPNAGPYGLQNFSYGNGFGNAGLNRPFGY